MERKVTIECHVQDREDEKALNRMMSADNVYGALWDIHQNIFRAARKHGYQDAELNTKMEAHHEPISDFVGLLEAKFFEILKERDIDLDDYL